MKHTVTNMGVWRRPIALEEHQEAGPSIPTPPPDNSNSLRGQTTESLVSIRLVREKQLMFLSNP